MDEEPRRVRGTHLLQEYMLYARYYGILCSLYVIIPYIHSKNRPLKMIKYIFSNITIYIFLKLCSALLNNFVDNCYSIIECLLVPSRLDCI